jgi:hypothetical protein
MDGGDNGWVDDGWGGWVEMNDKPVKIQTSASA